LVSDEAKQSAAAAADRIIQLKEVAYRAIGVLQPATELPMQITLAKNKVIFSSDNHSLKTITCPIPGIGPADAMIIYMRRLKTSKIEAWMTLWTRMNRAEKVSGDLRTRVAAREKNEK
jgi:hypothetical protein